MCASYTNRSRRTRLRWWQLTLRVALVVMTPCVFLYRSTHPIAQHPSGGFSAYSHPAKDWPEPYAPPSAPLPAWVHGTEAFASSDFLSDGVATHRHFETQTFERRLRHKNFVIIATYPQLVRDEGIIAQGFNRAVAALVNADLAPYLVDKRDARKERDADWRDVQEYHNITHKIVFASDELVSVLLYVDGYIWGAPRGYHYPLVLNYDLKHGRVLQLADLFKPDADYLPVLMRYCRADLVAQLGHDALAKSDLRYDLYLKARISQAWVLTPTGLAVIFGEYQLGDYAAGEPKVLLPYAALRDIVDRRGPLSQIAALN